MSDGPSPSLRRPRLLPGVRAWDLWALRPVSARLYVITVIAAAAAAAGYACLRGPWHLSAVLTGLVLLACAMIAVETTRRVYEAWGTIVRDFGSVWLLAAAVTLPPAYPILISYGIAGYKLARIPRPVRYRRVFSGANLAIAYGAASAAFHAIPASVAGPAPGTGAHALTWTACVTVSGVVSIYLAEVFVAAAIKLTDPAARVRAMFASRQSTAVQAVQITLAVVTAAVVTISPLLAVLALPAIALCRKAMMSDQLSAPARLDPVTGTLNSHTWRQETEAAFLRARHAGRPLAVALVQVDNLDDIAQAAGEPVRQQILHAVAGMLADELPGGALVGRAEGDTFAVAMPGAAAEAARRTGERLRDRVAAEPVEALSGEHAGYVFRLTASVGIAVMTESRAGVPDLVTAASGALTAARATGLNHVHVGLAGHTAAPAA
jgi:diguanylate cyclase (GGDEF)-like protein